MHPLLDRLRTLADEFGDLAGEALRAGALRGVPDDDLLVALADAGRARRAVDAVLLEATSHVVDRSSSPVRADRMTARHGCRDVPELLQRTTRLPRRSVVDVVAAAKVLQRPTALRGELLPGTFPALREALAAAEVGVDAVLAVTRPLSAMSTGAEAVAAADEELAAAARGDGVDGGPPASVDDLRQMALVWATYLDPDGAEPAEARALRARGLVLGIARDGVVPLRGSLLPEVAQQLQLGFDSLLNPKIDGASGPGVRFVPRSDGIDGPPRDADPTPASSDPRTRAQKQHDALAIILTKATASLPTLGGAAPTLVVTVREHDLRAGRGYAHLGGATAQPVSVATARHIACSGAVQRVVLNESGRIVALGIQDRVFNAHQRRAILTRDGTCATPGCHVPAVWCEIHHIPDHSRGGPTHTDHGIPLCWFHHRAIDTSGWQYRITHGVPEVRGPAWYDAARRWRPITASPTRLLDRLERRRT